MIKILVAVFLTLAICAGIASAGDMARVPFPYVNSGSIIQFYAPDGTLTQQTTVVHKWIDLSKAVLYAVYSASGTCFERFSAVNGTNGTNVATPVPNTSWHVRAVNANTPYGNFSGCVGGFVKTQ